MVGLFWVKWRIRWCLTLFSFLPVTKLVGSDPVEFDQPEYEVTVPENTRADHLLRLSARVRATGRSPIRVQAIYTMFRWSHTLIWITFVYVLSIQLHTNTKLLQKPNCKTHFFPNREHWIKEHITPHQTTKHEAWTYIDFFTIEKKSHMQTIFSYQRYWDEAYANDILIFVLWQEVNLPKITFS